MITRFYQIVHQLCRYKPRAACHASGSTNWIHWEIPQCLLCVGAEEILRRWQSATALEPLLTDDQEFCEAERVLGHNDI